jgi:hypothetical protein
MAKTLLGSITTGNSSNFGLTRYIPIAGGGNGLVTAESTAQLTFRQNAVLSDLWLFIITNTLDTGASTLKVRVNGANVNQNLSINAGVTGEFLDSSNTDTISAGDEVALQLITSGTSGILTLGSYSISCNPSNHHTKLVANNPSGQSITASLTRYCPIIGSTIINATESNAQTDIRVNGTLKNFQVVISINSRSDSTAFKVRKNGTDGNQSISVSASTTGIFEDTSNTDSISTGDLLNVSITTGGGTGSIRLQTVYSELDNSGNHFEMGNTSTSGRTHVASTTYYLGLYGEMFTITTVENREQQNAQFAFTAKNLRLYISANATTASSTFRTRVNGANGAQSVSISAGATGWFSDLSNTDNISIGDLICFQLVNGAGGGVTTMLALLQGTIGTIDGVFSSSGLGSSNLIGEALSLGIFSSIATSSLNLIGASNFNGNLSISNSSDALFTGASVGYGELSISNLSNVTFNGAAITIVEGIFGSIGIASAIFKSLSFNINLPYYRKYLNDNETIATIGPTVTISTSPETGLSSYLRRYLNDKV